MSESDVTTTETTDTTAAADTTATAETTSPSTRLVLRWRIAPTDEPARSIIELAAPPDAVRAVLLAEAPTLDALDRAADDADDDAGEHVRALVATLLSAGCLTVGVGDADSPAAILEPMTPQFTVEFDATLPETIQLSRFAYLHALDGDVVLESPLSLARLRLADPALAAMIAALVPGASTAAVIDQAADRPTVTAVLRLLAGAGFAGAATDAGCALDTGDVLRQWDFADLVFHSRSRLGRHDYPMGGTFRFAEELPPPPVHAPRPWVTTIPLPRPAGRPPRDSGLIDVMERRRSVREQSAVPITIQELGEFLFHAARVRGYLPGPYGLTLSNRPYPTGGASYELEIYLTVDRCMGLAPGFYYYDAAAHGLAPISPPNAHTQQMLFGAYTSCGGTCYPQVLISIASRFQRIAWKYTGIAYATTLKNVGVLYSTFYLVGTAMGLAPCALGLGDSEQFTALSGTDRWAESLVGEFMLGGRAIGVQQ